MPVRPKPTSKAGHHFRAKGPIDGGSYVLSEAPARAFGDRHEGETVTSGRQLTAVNGSASSFRAPDQFVQDQGPSLFMGAIKEILIHG